MTPNSLSENHTDYRCDVVVIGGGAAGLSAAVALGRALRSVVVVDAGSPRNAPADAVHGFLGREGMNPTVLLEVGREEARAYGVTILDAEAVRARRFSGDFEVLLADGRTVTGRRLLLAGGLVDELPPIAGLAEQWGKGVLHCPYCHGYEIRGNRIGVVGTSPMSVHQSLLFRQWSDKITLFLNDTVIPSEQEWDQLAARSVQVVAGAVTSVDAVDGILTGVTVGNGRNFDLETVVVGSKMKARVDIVDESIGLAAQELFSGMVSFIEPGPAGSTAAPGVYVAGNVSNAAAPVIVAAAEGTAAGMKINSDLIEEETAWAVQGRNGPFSAAMEARVTNRVLGARRHGLTI
ncbi:NAD(P)/FAD-dependent oxidoreductase [Rhodococcus ruber]|uniref:NAD(P)/FAD-dependent oxidoreductase n=1 Tax=Rhodococcus ruber TaxID=1830 RepID=A0ABT4MEC9_9NOCA|nr:NAD(P)/FAD-dependent oxidoreductase [Rhodococcus ruber]MCZ4519354.1 NAD(P)/FAD-dependent oxidoreductase [Rhodococcus ruber]